MLTRIFQSLKHLGLSSVFVGCVLMPLSTHAPVEVVCHAAIGQIVTVKINSRVYGQSVPASVYLPPWYYVLSDALPVIYLLHGANADETQWPDLQVRPRADEMIAQGRPPFVVVMPGGGYHSTLDYSAFVLDDLIPAIEWRFHVQAARSGRAIGGLSIGGYWALRIAFSRPDQFAAVGGHSPVVGFDQLDDPGRLAQTAAGLDQLRVMLDAGSADPLRSGAALLAQRLRSGGAAVSLAVNPGGHDRPYWRSHTADYLQFYLDAFTPARAPQRCGAKVIDR